MLLARLRVSTLLAFTLLMASTGVAAASDLSDRDQVMLGMGILVIVLLSVLSFFYLLRHLLGLDKMPPAEPQLQSTTDGTGTRNREQGTGF